MNKNHILVVDDEESIVQTLRGTLRDEGFEVSYAGDGKEALALVATESPDVILLDIWLPGLDGIETLRALKKMRSDAEVIVMSGHGNIATALKVTKLGAFDYLEKPLALDHLIRTVHRALSRRKRRQDHVYQRVPQHLRLAERRPQRKIVAHTLPSPPPQPSQQRMQRTLRRSVVLYGQGLQSGHKTGLILSPLPRNSGIVFSNISTGETLPASIDFVESTDFCTNLHRGHMSAKTVEHIMSVLHAYGLSNVLIKISDEIPIMDGSAVDFCQLIEDGGIEEQGAIAEEFIVDQCYHIGNVRPDAKFILVEPCDGFRVTYRLDYPQPLGVQEFTYAHQDGASYRREIAPSRTFGFVREVERMHELGLVAGGRLNNVILIDDEKIVNSAQLRFPNEFARHKVLDIIGDFYLLGARLRGHVRANMTGHTENVALVRKLRAAVLGSD